MAMNGFLGIGLTVPSMTQAVDYYSAFGMDPRERDTSVAVSCGGRAQDEITLVEGERKRLAYISFGCDADGLAGVRQRLAQRGIDECAPLDGVAGDGFWFRDPHGVLVNLRAAAPVPGRTAEPVRTNFADRRERVDQPQWLSVLARRRQDRGIRPRRLGHAVLFTPDLAASERFYRQVLGLGFSDREPGLITLFNAGRGDHHVFGFVQSTHNGLHHASFEVGDIDEVAIGAEQMAQRGHTTAWGLGRHTIGSNIFHYIRDPWGSWTEYYTDMDQITEDWEGKEWAGLPPGIWCPTPPAEFLTNLEDRENP